MREWLSECVVWRERQVGMLLARSAIEAGPWCARAAPRTLTVWCAASWVKGGWKTLRLAAYRQGRCAAEDSGTRGAERDSGAEGGGGGGSPRIAE
jgi:hypothetical protein